MTQIYTQKTVRAVAGIKEQQLRSWKTKVNVGQLDEPNARYDFSEVLTLYIISMLVNDLGMTIGAVAPFSNQLFDICAGSDLTPHKSRVIVITPAHGSCAMKTLLQIGENPLEVVISLDTVMQEIIAKLTRIDVQPLLPL